MEKHKRTKKETDELKSGMKELNLKDFKNVASELLIGILNRQELILEEIGKAHRTAEKNFDNHKNAIEDLHETAAIFRTFAFVQGMAIILPDTVGDSMFHMICIQEKIAKPNPRKF